MDGNFDHVVELLAELRAENGYLKTQVTRLTEENRRLKRYLDEDAHKAL